MFFSSLLLDSLFLDLPMKLLNWATPRNTTYILSIHEVCKQRVIEKVKTVLALSI